MSDTLTRSPRTRRTEAEWKALIEEIAARGLSVPEAAAEYGVNKQSIYTWQRKLCSEAQPMKFQEFTIVRPSRTPTVEIQCGTNTRLVCRDLSVTDLATLIKAIEGGASC